MAIKYSKEISSKLNIAESKVGPTIKLLEDDNTIPFISRYRKEVTGSLDESQVLDIQKELTRLKEIEARRQTILKEIKKQGKLTDELKQKILNTASLTELEDIYLPYKPKRKTKATIAKSLGLEPLAKTIFSQKEINLGKEAKKYLTDKVKNTGAALEGARNIISEWVAEDKKARDAVRRLFEKEAVIYSRVIKGKEEQGSKFKDYFEYSEPLSRISSHRLLALRRGEKEKILRV
ncbi:MAG: Tex-like N-terminal domain-containing protein, partial [Actinomycetota bacterium]